MCQAAQRHDTFAQGVTKDFKVELIKEFQLNSDKAAILAAGNKTFKIAVDKTYIDNTFGAVMYGNQVVDFVMGPAGSSTGSQKITIKNVVITARNVKSIRKALSERR